MRLIQNEIVIERRMRNGRNALVEKEWMIGQCLKKQCD